MGTPLLISLDSPLSFTALRSRRKISKTRERISPAIGEPSEAAMSHGIPKPTVMFVICEPTQLETAMEP